MTELLFRQEQIAGNLKIKGTSLIKQMQQLCHSIAQSVYKSESAIVIAEKGESLLKKFITLPSSRKSSVRAKIDS